MEFKKCSIAGKSYGDAFDEFGNSIVITEVICCFRIKIWNISKVIHQPLVIAILKNTSIISPF